MTTPDQTDLLTAILPHVAFDGWSDAAFSDACADLGLDMTAARALCPRGAVDLAVAYHKRGDDQMVAALQAADLSGMRFRDKVAHAIRLRLEVGDREIVRRGSSLFALPHMAPEGASLIWGTADAIWTALGDTSEDVNWYTKRASLSAVYGSVVLFWLGDESPAQEATWAFVDRRIENVMQFEKVKASVRENPLLRPITGPLGQLLSHIRAPSQTPRDNLPGHWSDPQ